MRPPNLTRTIPIWGVASIKGRTDWLTDTAGDRRPPIFPGRLFGLMLSRHTTETHQHLPARDNFIIRLCTYVHCWNWEQVARRVIFACKILTSHPTSGRGSALYILDLPGWSVVFNIFCHHANHEHGLRALTYTMVWLNYKDIKPTFLPLINCLDYFKKKNLLKFD